MWINLFQWLANRYAFQRRSGSCKRFLPRLEELEGRITPTVNLAMTNAFVVNSQNQAMTPDIGEEVYIQAVFTSQTLPSNASYVVGFTVDGVTLNTSTISLGAGQSGTQTWSPAPLGGWFASPGIHHVSVTVDPSQTVAESTYADNTFTFTFTPVSAPDLPQQFVMPLGGTPFQTWGIGNYVDVNPLSPAYTDYQGGDYAVDGHMGHDIGLANFGAMDAGVPEYAVANGTVTLVRDGYYDRETGGNRSLTDNDIHIDLGNGWQVIYAHLRTDTILVHVGDHVVQGQILGLAGSSGTSTRAHLHFQVMHNGDAVEPEYDPSTFWSNPLSYQSSVSRVQDSGITSSSSTTRADLIAQERPVTANVFTQTSPTLTLWFTAYTSKNDSISYTFYQPDGSVYAPFNHTFNPGEMRGGLVYYYYNLPTGLALGTWHVAIKINGTQMAYDSFQVSTAGAAAAHVSQQSTYVPNGRTTPIDVGTVSQGSGPPQLDFTVNNIGSDALSLSNLVLPSGFSLVGSLPSSVSVGNSATFTIQMTTSATGTNAGVLSFKTNDPNASTYSFAIKGTVSGGHTGEVHGQVFNDLNSDGIENGFDTGLSGWTVSLLNSSTNVVVATTTTGNNGYYAFLNLAAGTYSVKETLQPGWGQTTANPANVAVTTTDQLATPIGAAQAVANHLAFSVQPSPATVGHTINPAVQVQVFDQFGNFLSSDNSDQVMMSVASGSGSFTNGSTTIVTVSGGTATFGNLALTAVGSYTLKASISGLNSSPVSTSFTVTSATPTLTWNNPAAIAYGTALSSTQLNASSSVPGTFVYTPPSGTVLPVGNNQTLGVTFTPTDTVDYTTANASVTINVIRAAPIITWANPAAIVYGTALGSTQLNASSSVPGTFVYTPAAGSVLNAGNNQTLSIAFTPTDTVDYTNASASVKINVNKATPTVSWANPAAIVYGTALGSTQLNAGSSVPGTFTYSPAAGTVLHAGDNQTLSVNFTPTDTTDYATASSTVSINVTQATPGVSWANPAAIVYGTALSNTQLNASSSVPGTFTYSPASGQVLHAGNNQTLSVTFTPTDTTDYTTATASASINVAQATPTLTWANPSGVVYGTALSSTQLNASSSVAGTFQYAPAAGTVLNAGNNQPLSVTFTPTDTTDYTTATASASINVSQAIPDLTWANPADIVYGTALSSTQLNASSNVPGTFNYTPAAGTILNTGNNQTLSITFTPTDTTDYTTASASVTINVTRATPTLTWASPAAIVYGTALSGTQLDAASSVPGTFLYTPASGTVLHAGNNQTLSVTFTPNDTTNYTSASTSVSINVTQAIPTVTWATPPGIVYGTVLSSTQLNASSSVPGTFTYSPAAGTVLSIGNNQPLGVTFNPTDSTDYASATASITIDVTQATPTITWANPGAIVYGTALTDTQLDASANVPGTFDYTPAAGTILSAGNNQTLSVTFTPTDTANYTTTSDSVSIDVTKAAPTVTWANPIAIVYGTALTDTQLDASANVPGTFDYTLSIGTVLHAGTNQLLGVTFTPNDTADYATVSTSVSINVTQATPPITWANPAAIVYGTALSSTQLDASSSVPGTFSYTPAAGTVLHAGNNQSLSVIFTPTDTIDYTPVNGTVSISVSQATPTITWTNPADIIFGTALSSTQLDANSSVPGTFSYTPAAGSVLHAGTDQALGVTFTPANTTDFAPVTAAITINVLKATPTLTWNAPAPITYGTALSTAQLNALATVPGTFAYTPSAGTVLAAGNNQPLRVTFMPADTTDFTSATAIVQQSVSRASLTISANLGQQKAYGTADPMLSFHLSSGSLVKGDSFVGGLSRVVGENAGTYAITLGNLSAGPNYTVSLQGSTTFTITPAPLTITPDPGQHKTYGSPDPMLTFSTSGLANSDTPSIIHGNLVRTPGENAGNYAINRGNLAVGANYTLIFSSSVQFTITPALLMITVSPGQHKTYGSNNPSFTFSVGPLAHGDTARVLGGKLSRVSGENAGAYAITQGTLSAGANYQINLISTNFSITPAPLLVIPTLGQHKVYGASDPNLKFSVRGLVHGDSVHLLSGQLSRTSGENVGAYAINPGTLSAGGNYTISLASGRFSITPAPLKITPNASQGRTYGAADPVLTFSISGLANGDTASVLSGTLSRTSGENTGSYLINRGNLTAGANYKLLFVNGGKFTITPAVLTITVTPNQQKTYGASDPTFTFSIGPLAHGDTAKVLSGKPTRAAGESVGSYAINLGTLSAGANYTINLIGADFTIVQRPITVTADPKTKVAGQPDPMLTYRITSGSLAFRDYFTGSLTRVSGEVVGNYEIEQGTLALSGNYLVTFVVAQLTIRAG